MARPWIALLAIGLSGCSRATDTPAAGVSATPSASVAPAPSAAPTAATSSGTWSGRYAAIPGPFSVPDGGEWAGVRFRGEDASVGLGEGTISLSVDPNGRVSGSLDGPLGPLRVTGELTDKELSAALVSSEPATGFAGVAVGALATDRISGTMHLSLPTGNVLREASFSLRRKP